MEYVLLWWGIQIYGTLMGGDILSPLVGELYPTPFIECPTLGGWEPVCPTPTTPSVISGNSKQNLRYL
jgi:hypothetical protein